jgi:ATP-dependent DNA ligase
MLRSSNRWNVFLSLRFPRDHCGVYEVKLDGYRAIAVNTNQGKAALFSRHGKSFNKKFPDVFNALAALWIRSASSAFEIKPKKPSVWK